MRTPIILLLLGLFFAQLNHWQDVQDDAELIAEAKSVPVNNFDVAISGN